MITNFGKTIFSKYLLGQIDNYANYIAIGTGENPGDTPSATQTSLFFEAARYPIISRGITYDTATSKSQIVLTAQIDSIDRFEITEIGLYPGAYNSLLSNGVNSKMLLDFSNTESWTYNNAASYNLPLVFISNPLDTGNTSNTLDAQTDGATTLKAYSFDVNNSFFNSTRIARYERPRIYDSSIMVLGDMSTTSSTGPYIEYSGFTKAIDLDKAINQVDELRVAFTVINTTTLTSIPSGGVQFTVRFLTNDGQTYRDYLFDTTSSVNTTWITPLSASSRYVVGKQTLDKGTSNGNFNWSAVNTVRIYAKATDATASINTQTPTGTTNISITTSSAHGIVPGQRVLISGIVPSGYNGVWTAQTGTTGTTLIVDIGSNPGVITTGGTASASPSYGIIFDALRFESMLTNNPLYGLVGYSIPSTNIVKQSDTYGLVEFRFNLGVS